MGTSEENESNESGSSGDTYYYEVYEVDTSGIEEKLDTIEQTLADTRADIASLNENINGGVGVLIGMFGLVIGFNSAKELLKIWLH